jgi:Flp pilus assembly protein TadG
MNKKVVNRLSWKRFLREECGGTIVEFAISAVLLFASFFGIMDFARALYAYHFVSYAAQEGSRYAMVRGNDWSGACASATSYGCTASSANITSYVQGLATMGISSGNITATPSWPQLNADDSSSGCSTTPTQNSQGCLVKVKVSYAFHFIMPFLPLSAMNMTATSEQPISY